MAGFDFLNNDYMKAASNFGSNLGSGMLSTLGTAGETVTTAVDQTGGYLSSLSEQPQQYIEELTKKPTTVNPNTQSSASLHSSLGNTLNLNSLTSGLNNLQTPNVLGTMNNVGNNIASTMSPITMSVGSLTQGTVINPEPRPTFVDNNLYPISSMLNPSLPTITDASKLMTPYTETAMRSLGSKLSPQSPNTMVFDAAGNLVNYGGVGAQKLFNDATMITTDVGNKVVEGATEATDATMDVLNDTGKGIGKTAKEVLWDAPYALGGYTGNIAAKSGQMTMQQIENVIGNAKDVTVSKVKTEDGGTIIKWKPQEKPEMAKSYPKEKESELFNKGDSYITEGIPDNLKYKTYKTTKGDVSGSGSDYSYIPGKSQMMVKGLRLDGSDKETDSEKIVNSISGNTFDPNKEVIKSEKMNDIASKYYYNQQQESATKEKKKNNSVTYRKKNRFIPNVMLINNINRIGRVNTQRVNPLQNHPVSKKKVGIKSKPIKKEEQQFLYRQPDIAFKVSTIASGVSNKVGGIESFVSLKPKKDVINISNLTNNNNIMGNNKFEFNLDGLLLKPKKKILK